MTPVRRALLSVSDKTGLLPLARGLAALGVELLSTGGTARALASAGLAVREVAEVTGFPEMLDGRVKTLHPAVHGGILARRDRPEHQEALARHGIGPIDLVAVSLYPFETVAVRPGVSREAVVEEIDVGGPALIRAAAKNHDHVVILVDPAQYEEVLEELGRMAGTVSPRTRHRLAVEAFRRTARYDTTIAGWLASAPAAGPEPVVEPDAGAPAWPPTLRLEAERVAALRYGENPHQAAALYRPLDAALALGGGGVSGARQLHGPELSFNNILDFSAALGLLVELAEPAAVVVKHTNPCGAATGSDVATAIGRARASDPVSIYGGIVGVNRPVDLTAIEALSGVLLEILFAPAFDPEALARLRATRKKLRVLEVACDRRGWPSRPLEVRSVLGGLLVQTADGADLDEASLKVVSRRQPTDEEWRGLRFAWRVAKHVKSNAIVLAGPDQVLGVGAGQMSRVDAARLAVARGREHGHELASSVAASDAFFPFRDGLDVLAGAGAAAVIHPGGSIRDDEVVAAADANDMALVVTGLRHFKH